jgi:Icc-related predicted phosphoesterase
MKKIWHISDTHTFHKLLTVPENIDIVIFSGDCSNPRDPYNNEPEVKDFIQWFKELPIKHKIFVAGNHDTSIEKSLIKKIDFTGYNIHYLENNYVDIEGIKIFGSPNQPTFGYDWSFQKKREKLDKHWSKVDNNVDIFIVHGPPKGILDLSYDRNHRLENCGCNALKRHVLHRIKPKFCLFGHIHNVSDIINAGVLKLSDYPTVFSNGSVVTDGKFGKLSSNGNILEYV